MRKTLCRLKNDWVSAVVYDDATADLEDLKTHQRWSMGPVAMQEDGELDVGHNWQRTGRSLSEQYPGRFRGQIEGEAIRYTVLGRLEREMGSFTCQYRLAGAWLEVEILEVDDALPNLMFPPPIESESLVLPQGVGCWIKKSGGLYDRKFYRFLSGLNMRWFGGLCGEAGWLAIVDEGHTDAGVLRTQLCATPAWMKSMASWQGPRAVRYRFTTGGYVGLAKAFRAWAQEHGLLKTLAEKIERCPAVANSIGGRMVGFFLANTFKKERWEDRGEPIPKKYAGKPEGMVTYLTYADVRRIMDECKTLGMKKGLFTIHGWINGGYDETHPDIWPPEPVLGTLDELRDLCAEADPYITSLHDNYQDIYPQSASFPMGICLRRDGSYLPGGVWAGGQCYILNSERSLEAARENWVHLKTLGLRALYSDTLTAELFRESYEPGHEQTRSQDEERKAELMQFFCDQGLVFSSENGMDFGVPYTDWTALGTHIRTTGESVPLWPLVYHDCVVSYKGTFSHGDFQRPGYVAEMCLENLLWGYGLSLGGFTAETWPSYREAFKHTTHVGEWHERIGLAEMTGHRFLSEDGQVERTEYANGLAIMVNFAAEPRQAEGQTVPARGYKIVE